MILPGSVQETSNLLYANRSLQGRSNFQIVYSPPELKSAGP